MKGIVFNHDVLVRTFGCDAEHLDGYYRLDCWGEGSCFFHSMAILTVQGNTVDESKNRVTYHMKFGSTRLNITVPMVQPFQESFRQVGVQIRKNLGEEINSKLWAQFTEHNHINPAHADEKLDMGGVQKELQNESTWANIWTIRYTAWRLGLNILFINPDSKIEPLYCGVENFAHGQDSLFIYWSNHQHFEPVVRQVGKECTRTFGQDHAFIKCLRNQYKRACPSDPIES